MEKENVVNNKGLSSRKSFVRDLPSAKSLLNKEKQPYCIEQAEGPGQQPAGTTTFFNKGGFPPALVIPVLAVRAHAGYSAGYKSGFTLIELLVVVLIIGILASVALPQYQKAVEKSRAMEALQLLKTVDNAVDAYYLASGEWPKTFEELSIEIPWSGRQKAYVSSLISDARSNGKWSVQLEGNNRGGYYSIQATRLDGKYTGSSFMVQKMAPASYDMPLNTYLCGEYKNGSVTFSAEAGSFCIKIIGGTFRKEYGASRVYNLPW